jgi:hypothetical protein
MGNSSSSFATAMSEISEVSAVDNQFNLINEQMNQLDQVTSELFRRLNPVLTPIALSEGSVFGNAKDAPVAPLTAQVARVAHDLESAVDYLRSLLPRIEV